MMLLIMDQISRSTRLVLLHFDKYAKMPASYSKKRKADSDKAKEITQVSHAGGPLKRTNTSDWDTALGPSIDVIPSKQLPQVRTVLQRYRALRIESPHESKGELVKKILGEIIPIWVKSRLPTMSIKACERKVGLAIESWGKCHRPGGRHSEEFQSFLDELLSLAVRLPNTTEEKFLESYRKHIKDTGNPAWETDYTFFIDQYQVNFLF